MMTEITQIPEHCELCPRRCGANRLSGQSGLCGGDNRLFVARAALHFWEEPCISGSNGSGAVFFSGCPLQCVFCQNFEISHERAGKEISVNRLAEIFLELQAKGADNLNLVSPTHSIPWIVQALHSAKGDGFSLPVIYNTSGYERVETLRLLEGYVDVWLPDFKYFSSEKSKEYSGAADYFAFASSSLDEMVRQAGDPVFDERGMMTRGVIVRHLMLPGMGKDTKQIIRYLYERYGDCIYLSLMNQYTPLSGVRGIPALNRKLTREEYDEAIDYALSLGLENGFIQEEGTADESFIPPFDNEGV